jgi:hypothetical protein
MPALFKKRGLCFLYPENWTLDEQDFLSQYPAVAVYSPGGAFWLLSVHPQTSDPGELALSVVDALREEYEDVETEIAEETIAGQEMVGYDLAFFHVALTNTATVRAFRGVNATYTIFCQAEDREYAQISDVFSAMTVSFLNDLKGIRITGFK